VGRRKLHERLQRDFPQSKEEEDRQERFRQLAVWCAKWGVLVIDQHRGRSRDQVYSAILRAAGTVMKFCEEEAHLLPSRVLCRRVVVLDDMAIRMVNNALPSADRDTLEAEVTTSVKNHGGPAKAHRTRLLRCRYGIPRF
jgi:hypothetical protein